MSVEGPGPGVRAVIAAYAPRSLSPAAAVLVRELVAVAGPRTPGRAKAFLFACSRLVRFCEQTGAELEGGVLFADSTVERFVLEGCQGFSPATRRTLRTNLRALARALEPFPQPGPLPLGREHARQPYTDVEIDGFPRLAAAQSTVSRRMRATALVCLGAGAGVTGSELLHLRGSDVTERAGGVIVLVSGARARRVPVLARYQQPLLSAAGLAGGRFILGGASPSGRNTTDRLVRVLCADSSLPRLQAGRLRVTWLSACASQIGLGVLMQAAGITHSQRLLDLAAELPAVSDGELIARLGDSA